MEALEKVKKVRKDSKVARLVNAQIELLRGEKNQAQIAAEAGYKKANIITMFKMGDTRVPLKNINQLAKALEVDPARMTRIALQEYEPEIWTALSQALGEPVSANELHIIQRLRELTDDADYELSEIDEDEALQAFARTLKANKTKPATRHVVS